MNLLAGPAITKAELAAMLARNYRLGKLLSYSKLKKGLGNALYRLDTEKGIYTLKIAIRNNPLRVRYEIELLAMLRNLPTPRPLKTKSGDYLFTYKEHKAFVYPFLRGTHRERITTEMIREVGAFLGKLHLQTEGFSSRIKRMKFYDIHAKNLQKVVTTSLKAKHPKIREAVAYMGKELPHYRVPTKLPQGAMHIDLKPENTLFDKGHLSGVLDFDNSYNGALVLDLANTLMWFCSRKGKFDLRRARMLCAAYQKKRKLSRQERAAFFDVLHYAYLTHVLADIYLEYSPDYPNIRIPESYMLWEIENLLATERNLPNRQQFEESLLEKF